jgi:hypothetical protein
VPELTPIAQLWDEFDVDYYEEAAQWARTWLIIRIKEILDGPLPLRGTRQANRIVRELRRMTNALQRNEIIRGPPRNDDSGGNNSKGTKKPGGDPWRHQGRNSDGDGMRRRDTNMEHLAELEQSLARFNVQK